MLDKSGQRRFTSYLFELKLGAGESATNVQNVHVEAEVRLDGDQAQFMRTNLKKTWGMDSSRREMSVIGCCQTGHQHPILAKPD